MHLLTNLTKTRTLRLPLNLAESGFHQIPIEGERIEISEAECDINIDTLKKLKLGMGRSSLWSRPGGGGNGNTQPSQPSDYSIAV